MPPPSFSGVSGLSTLNVSRGTLGLIKDAAQAVHAALTKVSPATLEAARTSVQSLLQDASLDVPALEGDLLGGAEAHANLQPSTVRTAVSEKIHADMLEAFDNTQPTPAVLATVAALLELLAPLLDVTYLHRDWWERALYPALLSTQLSDPDARRVRVLTVFGMLAQPQAPEGGESASDVLAHRVFDLFVQLASKQPELAPLPEDMDADERDAAPAPSLDAPHPVTPGEDKMRRELEMILALYSTHAPTGFFQNLADALQDEAAESPVFYLLASFVHAQSMHAYRVSTTPLFEKLLYTLAHTRSTRTISLGTMCLVMLLPHIPQHVVKGGGGGVLSILSAYGRAVTWRRGNVDGANTPSVRLLFTLLYGLFPNNVLRFVRSPASYLAEHTPTPLDDTNVRAQSVRMLQSHAAHPGLVELDATTELSNTKRWAQQDASDLMAACMSLCLAPREELMSVDALLHEHVPANATLLLVEHRFELYLKEQLLLHIGRLHRDRIADAAGEAEHQSLYHTVRTLRAQLSAAQAQAERQRAETQAASSRHVQWERELNNKLNTYREERRNWSLDTQQLKKQLEDAQTTIASQTAEISRMGTRLFELEQDLENARPKFERLQEYNENVQKLSNCLSDWEEDLGKYELQSREMDKLLSWWEEMELTLENSEANARRYRNLLEQRTTENTRLKSEMNMVRADAQRQAQRLAANQTWLLEAVVAPENDRALPLPSTPVARPKANEELERVRGRNKHLELEMLDLRARIEELENEARIRTRHLSDEGLDERGATLFSPNTLHTPCDSRKEDETVPPLSLGSPVDSPAPQN